MTEDQLRQLEKAFARKMKSVQDAGFRVVKLYELPELLEEYRFDPVLTEADVTFLRTNGIEPW